MAQNAPLRKSARSEEVNASKLRRLAPAELKGLVLKPRLKLAVGCSGSRFQQDVEVVGVNGAKQSIFAVDVTSADQIDQRLFEAERPFLLRDRDFLMKVLERVAANVMSRAVADHQQLGRGNTSTTHFLRKQNLRVHRGDSHREFLTN